MIVHWRTRAMVQRMGKLDAACGIKHVKWPYSVDSSEHVTCPECKVLADAHDVVSHVKNGKRLLSCRHCFTSFSARWGAGAPTIVCPNCGRPHA